MMMSRALFLAALLAVGLSNAPAAAQALRIGAPAPEVAGTAGSTADP